jgi:hypothetical protein
MLHKNVLPPIRGTDFGGVQRVFEDHDEFSFGRLCVARSRLIRMRRTVAIKPEAERQIYWTMVSIDTLVSIGATSASSLERLVAMCDTLVLILATRYEGPIAHSLGVGTS